MAWILNETMNIYCERSRTGNSGHQVIHDLMKFYAKVHKLTLQYQILINCKSTDVNFVTWIYESQNQRNGWDDTKKKGWAEWIRKKKYRWWWLTLNFMSPFSSTCRTLPSIQCFNVTRQCCCNKRRTRMNFTAISLHSFVINFHSCCFVKIHCGNCCMTLKLYCWMQI
jgi:hypothetical protein